MMIRWLCLCWAGLALLSAGLSQELESYLKQRKTHKTQGVSPLISLEIVVGTKVIEVEGRVSGYIRGDEDYSLLLQTSEGKSLAIKAKTLDSWLLSGQVPTRALIRVTRKNAVEAAEYHLVAAIPPAIIARWENEEKARLAQIEQQKRWQQQQQATNAAASQSKRASTSRSNSALSSRGKSSPTAPALMSGDSYSAYYRFIRSYNKRLSHEDADIITRAILHYSNYYGVDPRFITAIVLVESGFNPNAKSRAGAMGLGQLMPGTARGMGVVNPYDPVDNLEGSIRLVRGHLEKYWQQSGNPQNWEHVILTLAAYNAGSGAVRKHGGVPPYKETQNYVQKVIRVYKQLCGIKE